MAVMRCGARLGAAAFAVGVSLAGPQAVGVAVADDAGPEAPSVSAGDVRGGAVPAGRSREARSAARDLPVARAAAAMPEEAAPTQEPDRPQPGPVRRPASVRSSVAVPSAAVASASAPAVGAARPLSAPIALPIPGASPTPAAPVPLAAAESVELGAGGGTAAPANPLEAVNDAVVGFFDAAQAWLAGLPGGPLTDLLSGALMLVRRSLFNQQPTADPYQFLTRANGQLVGTLGTVDPEGSALSYSLTGAPEFGTVQLSSDGTWTYTPRADVAPGTKDSFTVVVSDGGGLNILKPATPAREVEVAVGDFSQLVTSDAIKGSGAGHWFNVVNYSSSPVSFTQLIGECPKYCTGDDLMYVPPIGTVLGVGDMTHFQIGQWVFLQFNTQLKFTSVPGAYIPENWTVTIHSAWGSTASGPSDIGCDSGDCTADHYNGGGSGVNHDRVFLLDPPGTQIHLGSADAQKQADILSRLCGSQPDCAFDPISYDEAAFSDWRDKAAPYSNLTDVQQSYTFKQTSSVKTSSTLKVSESLGITLGKIVKAGIAKERSDSWEESNSFEYTYPVNVPAHTRVNFLWRDPIKSVTGDFTTKLGNTTWNLTNITFGFPDPARQGEIKVTQTPVSNLG